MPMVQRLPALLADLAMGLLPPNREFVAINHALQVLGRESTNFSEEQIETVLSAIRTAAIPRTKLQLAHQRQPELRLSAQEALSGWQQLERVFSAADAAR